MSGLEKPIYLIGLKSEWLATDTTDKEPIAVLGYATVEDARRQIGVEAKRLGLPKSLFRIAEFEFTGKVLEG